MLTEFLLILALFFFSEDNIRIITIGALDLKHIRLKLNTS